MNAGNKRIPLPTSQFQATIPNSALQRSQWIICELRLSFVHGCNFGNHIGDTNRSQRLKQLWLYRYMCCCLPLHRYLGATVGICKHVGETHPTRHEKRRRIAGKFSCKEYHRVIEYLPRFSRSAEENDSLFLNRRPNNQSVHF